jgi:phosphoglycolate phosphatase-like HAD superfamily hydrolase
VPHIIWDWNGTLFDDAHLVVESVNASLRRLDVAPIDAAVYRRHFVRPLHLFYERLLGSAVDDDLMKVIDDAFHEAYLGGLPSADLAVDTRTALGLVATAGVTQSIASMMWHEMLVSAVTGFGLEDLMLALDGNRGLAGETKEQHLMGHVERLEAMYPGMLRSEMVAIGDITDDAAAARAAGIGCVLYDGGSQDRDLLEAEAVPVAKTLVEAVRLALV